MLTRAAKRTSHLRYAQSIAERLQLPFLCPVLSRPEELSSSRRSIASRPSNAKAPSTPFPACQARQLASAAPLPESFDRNDDYSLIAYGSRDVPIAQRRRRDLSSLQPWDLANILHIDTSTAPHPEYNNTNRVTGNEIRGNATEVERNFEACLLLKKWPRALAGLQQLRLLYHTDTQRLRFQYNRVLAHLVDDLIQTRTSEHEETITQWIERDMKQAGLEPDVFTLALVIKAALSSSGRSKRERTVRRYWDMARRYDVQGEVGSLRSILTERDLGMISEICPLEADDLKDLDVHEITVEPEILVTEDIVSERPDLDIKETDQKGLGLTALRETLALFSDVEGKHKLLLEQDQQSRQQHAIERQRRLELDAIDSAVKRWKLEHEKMAKMGVSGNMSHGRLGALLWQWHEILTKEIVTELKRVQEAENQPHKTSQDRLRLEYGPFLEQLRPEKTAAMTVIALVQIMSKHGSSKAIKLVNLVTELGKAIESEHQAEQTQLRARQHERKEIRLTDNFVQPPQEHRPTKSPEGKYLTPLARSSFHPASNPFLGLSEWTNGIHAKLGSVLCELMFDAARITITKTDETTGKKSSIAQPVFVRKRVYVGGKNIGAVTLHESFVEILSARPAVDAIAKQLPMLCQPRPWKGFKGGAYLESDQPVLRVKNGDSLQKDYIIAAAGRGDLDQLFAGLDVLGSTAWKINPKVFEVMVRAWNSGEEIANLPSVKKAFDYPQRPPADAPRKEKFDWYSRMRSIENEKSGIHSNRCFQNFQMEIAKAYLGEVFYLPHNLDFRGRAYPIPPYLNQMGADNCRGLLYFAKGRELGHDGLRWLKIHLSNVFGYDKASLDDRAQFPVAHIDDIRDSVVNPLGGRQWWLLAEDPWQCLATCFELVQALDSPEPNKFVSHLPVHQDGSCNGLQHYAALGGDVAGARQVNLEPGAKPADVYSGVADLVKAEIAVDAANGMEIAKRLERRITRKVVKQTVMTNVYGVTFLGAIRQIRRQVDDLLPDLDADQVSGKAATYIARKVFKALETLFTGAHDIQYWLGDCANRITGSLSPAQLETISEKESNPQKNNLVRPGKRTYNSKARKQNESLDAGSFRSSVVWTTPLKLPVVQPYRVNKGHKILTNLQRITLCEPSVADAVNKRKQLQAFPPNFVHSLDATHMLLSALKANEAGLTFTAVHDSFWTHAADVNTLSELLREAFIRMHTEDIIGRLAAEFRTRYKGHLYMASIREGSPLGRALKVYRQQMTAEGVIPSGTGIKALRARKYAELLREIKRRHLLQSDDPVKRQEGQGMITAATLFEKYDGEQYVQSQDSLGATAIGAMPHDSADATIEQTLQKEEAKQVIDSSVMTDPLIEEIDDEAIEDAGDEIGDAEHAADDDLPVRYEAVDAAPANQKTSKKRSQTRANRLTYAWLPLSFRPVPEKGDFDVSRLRESLYFFS